MASLVLTTRQTGALLYLSAARLILMMNHREAVKITGRRELNMKHESILSLAEDLTLVICFWVVFALVHTGFWLGGLL